jgi:hypothetical protein
MVLAHRSRERGLASDLMGALLGDAEELGDLDEADGIDMPDPENEWGSSRGIRSALHEEGIATGRR